MDDSDYIKTWLLGFLFLLGLSILIGIFLYNMNGFVNAAYQASTPIVEVLR